MDKKQIAIIGGGPAGLMAAEVLSAAGQAVTIYESMPTVGRKFLLAGKSGLNITHSEPYADFVARFGGAVPRLKAALDDFTPDDVRAWAAGLGTETFVGSSGRVFPKAMKASPLLRAWLRRLEKQGVRILTRHRWIGFGADGPRFDTADGITTIDADAVLLATGGASWPRLGSDGVWAGWLADKGVEIAPLRPANCGFDVAWSDIMRRGFAGAPIKSVTATSQAGTISGEFVISEHGIEGSLVYAHAGALRDGLARDGMARDGQAALVVDLMPGRSHEKLVQDLARQDRKASFSNRLRKGAGIEGAKLALLRELAPKESLGDPAQLATVIKALAIPVVRPRPIAEAISSAGGVMFKDVDGNSMLEAVPGTFVAGEMLDWEAPTGGYLLTACFATGRAAAKGILQWLEHAGL